MALYISDASKNLKKISGNFVNDPRKANVNLSNVTYPVITTGSTTTGSGDRVVETYISSNGNTWYRKWASGWKECGLNLVSGSGKPIISLPITFSTTTYSAVITPEYSEQGNSFWWAFITSKTRSTISLWNGYKNVEASGGGFNANVTLQIYCCGY